MLKRLFSLVSAFAVLFFCSVPALATGAEIGGGGAGIPIVGNINFDVVDFFEYFDNSFYGTSRYLANTVGHFINEDICPNAPQVGGGHNFVPRRTLKDGQVGRYNVCEYCGRAYGDVCEEAYEQYIDTLPGTQYTSSGSFYWSPEYIGLFYIWEDSGSSRYYFSPLLETNQDYLPAGSSYVSCKRGVMGKTSETREFQLSGDEHFGIFYPSNGSRYFSYEGGLSCFYRFDYPFSGSYTLLSGSKYQVFWTGGSASASYQQSEPVFWSAGQSRVSVLVSISPSELSSYGRLSYLSFNFCDPVYLVQPNDSIVDVFSLDTRVSGSGNDVTGMYGYMDNGTLVQSAADTIFTESGNVYTNPVTNETKNITNWDYDYVDRSYTLTTNEGDEVTVTYGDTNVTINEGGETYNIYYLVEHDDNVPCAHTYLSQVTQSPTCTGGGVRTFTCSTCGDTYTQEIPATGHDYVANVTTAPTCSASGVRTFTCTQCGDAYTQAIPATGHDYSSSVTQEATCTGTGVRTSVCSVCGDSHTETIPATGHSYSSEITTAPTCTETGVRTFICSVCGDVRTETISATGHSYSPEITMEPTCVTTGVRTFTCSECGDNYTRSIPATGHRWRILQTVPNQYDTENGGQLVQAGYTVYECDACGEQYRIDAAASGSALPMPSTGGTSTGTDLLEGDTEDGDSAVGKGFLLTIAEGITEDLPRVLELMSQWFTTIPALFEGYSKFLAASFGWMPSDCVMLLTFGVSTVTLIGILKAIRR